MCYIRIASPSSPLTYSYKLQTSEQSLNNRQVWFYLRNLFMDLCPSTSVATIWIQAVFISYFANGLCCLPDNIHVLWTSVQVFIRSDCGINGFILIQPHLPSFSKSIYFSLTSLKIRFSPNRTMWLWFHLPDKYWLILRLKHEDTKQVHFGFIILNTGVWFLETPYDFVHEANS